MNTRSGCDQLHARDQLRPELLRRGGSRPHVRAKTSLVISIAMSQRRPSHCEPTSTSMSATALAQPAGERVELHDVRPRREVRVAAAGDDPSPCATTRGRAPGRLGAAMKYSGCDATHG